MVVALASAIHEDITPVLVGELIFAINIVFGHCYYCSQYIFLSKISYYWKYIICSIYLIYSIYCRLQYIYCNFQFHSKCYCSFQLLQHLNIDTVQPQAASYSIINFASFPLFSLEVYTPATSPIYLFLIVQNCYSFIGTAVYIALQL